MNLVERLAKDWFDNGPDRENCQVRASEEARWWLNAIADELEQHENTVKGVMRVLGVETEEGGVAIWLRAQAKEPS